LGERGLGDRPLYSAVIWLEFELDRTLPWDRPPLRQRLADAPVGALFAWELQFATAAESGLPLSMIENNPAFRQVLETAPLPFREKPYLTVFEKIGPWRP
jgi:hypothetical protein